MATAADCPGKFDVIINGQGYLLDSTFDPSVYFKSQKASYGRTPTFIERSNVSGSWGDDEQAFFMTQTQKDWSLGGGQKYFNDPADATQQRKFWSCLRAEVTVEGEISLGARGAQVTLPTVSNLVSNGTFESDTIGSTPSGWSTVPSSTTFLADTTHVHSGSKAAKFTYSNATGTTNGDVAKSAVTTVSGTAYTISAWVYIPSSYTGSMVGLRLLSNSSATLTANMSLRDQWQLITGVNVSSAASNFVAFNCTILNGDVFWVDDITVTTTPQSLVCGSGAGAVAPTKHVVVDTAGNPWEVDTTGTFTIEQALNQSTSKPERWGVTTDGTQILLSTSTLPGAWCYHNNLLYACDGSTLKTPSTTLYTWKNFSGTAYTQFAFTPKVISNGSDILVFFPQLATGPELWKYDGTATAPAVILPDGAIGHDAVSAEGLVYLSGCVPASQHGSTGTRPTIWVWDGSLLEKVWESPYITSVSAPYTSAMPTLGVFDSDLVFTDPAQTNGPYSSPLLMRYVLSTGAIYPLDSYSTDTLSTVSAPFVSSTGSSVLLCHNDSTVKPVLYPYDFGGSAQLDTSLFTFDSSLTKIMRGVTVDWTGDTAPDVYYQVDSVEGSYTLLASAVTSGTEIAFPSNTTGRGVSIRVVIPSGTTKITRIYVRAAPELTQFRTAVYILNLSGNKNNPDNASLLTLRDGSTHSKDGLDMATDLNTAVASKTPIQITDRFGTFTGIIEPAAYELHEMRTGWQRAEFRAIVTVREV